MNDRTVDRALLFRMTAGTLACKFVERLLEYARLRVSQPLQARLNKHYAMHLFEARARLDVPTFDDPAIQRQIDSAASVNGQGVAWGTITMVSGLATTLLKVVTQVGVLAGVLKGQRDGILLAVLCMVPSLTNYLNWQTMGVLPGRGGTCRKGRIDRTVLTNA